jgi:hypothetical protein
MNLIWCQVSNLSLERRCIVKRICIVALLFVGLVALPSSSSSGDKQPDKEAKKKANLWMKAKTKLSQEILVGLTEGDFEKISKNAKALNLVDYFEVITRPKSDEYRQQANLFATANLELIRQAESKNIYGATLAYNQLTVSCVQCHVVVRKSNK